MSSRTRPAPVPVMPMKHLCLSAFALILAATLTSHATTILDDTFADGTRNNQNLPTDAAWWVSTAGAVTTNVGSMSIAVPTGSIMAISYFGANSTTPVSLGVGDTLTVSIKFTFNGVAPQNTSQNFRLCIGDFADSTLSPKDVTADGFSTSSQGAGVNAYGLFQNMGVTFNNSTPTTIEKRTTITDSSILGTGGDWTGLASGPGALGSFPGFTSGGQYVLQYSLQRLDATSLALTATWQSLANGATLTTSVTDSAASTFNFDGIALRPSGSASTASGIVFNEVRVDDIPSGAPPSITTQPQDQSIFAGQNATFNVAASGSSLNYQWYFNSSTAIPNATNSSLTISNAQTTDSGGYSVIVSNIIGSVPSETAELTVTVPTAPSIVAQPQGQTVLPGQSVTFNVSAGGTAPLGYQWYFDTNTLIANATSASLTLTNVQAAQSGTYSVVVSNFVSTAASTNAVLFVNTNPVAPSFVTEPASQIVLTNGTANFNAIVIGTTNITFQWNKNGVPISGATNATLILTGVQLTDAGNYTLTASNSVGSVVSSPALLTVTPFIPIATTTYNDVGFGRLVTGGGVLADTDPTYAKIFTATDLANAINSKTVKIIEIMTNLNLGYNEIEASAKAASEPFRADNTPLLHPVLLVSGVSVIDIQKKNGLTIFSTNGYTIKHAHLNIKASSNIIVRNLKFDELWEWDEATKGQYDKQNWDFITVGDAGTVTNLWIDHCTFTKAYDGIVDIVKGSSGITLSWCKYTGDDGYTNLNSFVWQQLNALEANKASYAMYNFLRNNGFSESDIFSVIQGHDKTHLIGPNDLDPNNNLHTVTLHHEWFINPGDRLPRLRGGNVHDFNIYVDDTQAIVANRMLKARVAAMSIANQNTFNNTYDFNNFLNGSISTESGAVLVEKSVYIDCLTPLRNNQTDPSNPTYTGKIEALDTIYHMDNADGSITEVRGNSTDPGNPLGPFQAAIIPFSWNANLPGGLPYSYTPDDPAQLKAIVTSPTGGAGAGVLFWAKTNWLITTYPATAPFVVAQPQNVSIAAGQNATLATVVGGSGPLYYQWYFNTNTPITGATNSVLTLVNVQSSSSGAYSVIITNNAGTATSTNALVSVTAPPASPQVSSPVFSGGAFSLTINGNSGQPITVQVSTNLTDWDDLFTTNPVALPFTWTDPSANTFSQRYYRIVQ